MVYGQAVGATAASTAADEEDEDGMGAGGGVGVRVVDAGKRVNFFYFELKGIGGQMLTCGIALLYS